MMIPDVETGRFTVFFDGLYGAGYIRREADGAETMLITGSDMADLRRDLNRAKTNATSRRRPYRPFPEIADVLLGEYFPCNEGRN